MRIWVALTAIVLAVTNGGCAPVGYYAHAVRGHVDLMSKREPIESLLADPATPDELRQRLGEVLSIRQFAVDELGLPDNDSYRSYADLGRPYVVWNVFATLEFSVEPEQWCFPFVGCVAYRGYFDEARARSFADGLEQDGRDVYVGGVAAYSTLGRFADPTLNTMMRWDMPRLAGLIFHELAHQQLYIKGDSAFNEAFASVVEEEGVRRWLAADAAALASWRRDRSRAGGFTALLIDTRARLAALYAEAMPESAMREAKRREFDSLRERYRLLKASWDGYAGYDGWFARDLNNAHLSSVATYRRLVPAFRALLARADGDFRLFFRRAGELAALDEAERAGVLRELMAASAP